MIHDEQTYKKKPKDEKLRNEMIWDEHSQMTKVNIIAPREC